jgi:DNA-binding winged helix-turn-helix (wHTH) protein
MRYVFGDYALDTDRYELRRAGMRLPLGPKAFEVLTYLLQHRGRAVTKEELLERLSPKQFVSESVLTSCILLVRKAIGDSGSMQQCIETVRGRGYRFIARVQEELGEISAGETPALPDTLGSAKEPSPGPAAAGPRPASVPPEPPSTSEPSPETESGWRAAGVGRPAAERRQLTVLVCRVSSAPLRFKPLDPEVLLEVGSDYQALCAAIVQRFAGHVA